MSSLAEDASEWLEADGLGGFASGTVSGARTRRYHALLLVATSPPGGRVVLVNGFDAWVETPGGRFALSTQRYAPDVAHPDGATRLVAFETDPWPRWTWRLEDGTEVDQEVFVPRETSAVVLAWRLRSGRDAHLEVRPFLSGRDYHALHHENTAFRFDADVRGTCVRWHPYADLPRIAARSNATYEHAPDWYRRFLYAEERARGLDDVEDLATPGTFRWELASEALLVFAGEVAGAPVPATEERAEEVVSRWRAEEGTRRARNSRLERSAEAYVARRGTGRTIVAGYPWFTDWGRDTFISVRGLCLATGRIPLARDILLEWAGHVSEGMLPNRFPDGDRPPEFNSVDASLWYVVTVGELLDAAGPHDLSAAQRERLAAAATAILAGYAGGTRYGIRADEDGLLAAGAPGVQLTWMDAKVGDWVVTPRIGKPVEVQALWLAALAAGARFEPRWKDLLEQGRGAFADRFWNEERGCLFDVVDVDHVRGAVDPSLRPNQIFAVGGLPTVLLEGDRARRVVGVVEERLWTPLGLRSLAPGERGYAGRYQGSVRERDGAYHQGTVWPWLAGAFVEAWLRVRGADTAAREEAGARFLAPLVRHLDEAGRGHVSEIADGDPPHTPRGCPFQAWSLGELLRIEALLGHPTGRRAS